MEQRCYFDDILDFQFISSIRPIMPYDSWKFVLIAMFKETVMNEDCWSF